MTRVGALVAVAFLAAGLVRGAEGWRELQKQGELLAKRARPAYEKAGEAARQAERFALRAGDAPAVARARRAQGRILQILRDSREYQTLAARGEFDSLSPLPGSRPEDLDPATIDSLRQELEAFREFLASAGRQYFRSADRQDRELPILFEALSLSHRLLGDLVQAQADEKYRRALERVDAGSEGPELAAARVRLLYFLRDFEAARAALARVGVDLDGADRELQIEHLRVARDLARFAGDSEQALALQRRLIALGIKEGEQSAVQLPLRGFTRGGARELVGVARTALRVARDFRVEPRDRDLCHYVAAQASLEVGQPAVAEEILSRIDLDPERDAWLAAQVKARLGQARAKTGDYEGSLSAYRSAVAILEADGDDDSAPLRARLRLNTAAVLLSLGDLPGAREEARATLRAAGEKDPALRVASRLVLGDVSYFTPAHRTAPRERHLEDALDAYRKAASELRDSSIDEATLEATLLAQVQIHLGNTYRELALLDSRSDDRADLRRKAIEAASGALRVARDRSLAHLETVAMSNLAELYLEDGDLERACQLVDTSLQRARQIGLFEAQWRSHWYLARLAERSGDLEEAARQFELAASRIEGYRARILDSGHKAGFMSSKQDFFAGMVRFHVERARAEAAFAVAERARSRAFIESLGLRFLLFAADTDRALYREYVELIGRADAARRGGGELYGVRDASGASYEELRERIESLRERIASHPDVSSLIKTLVSGAPADHATVQEGLAADEILLEYFSTGERLIAFLVSRDKLRMVRLEAEVGEIASAVDIFLDAAAADEKQAARLHDLLVEPLQNEISSLVGDGGSAGVTRVTIVPWGPLHRLPFEALRRDGRYLLETWEISYLPSATVLKYLPRPQSGEAPPSRLVALVDPDTDYDGDGEREFPPLPFARVEVEGISPLFGDAVILEDEAAAEDAYSRVATSGHVVHLACHGEFFPNRPMASTLYLSRGARTDGRLRAVEIIGTSLKNSHLVTLSGCETGRLEVAPGDDPVGLGTAFLHSGARALLVSLWKVEDQATASLMQIFYRQWLKGAHSSRAAALREAKLALLRSGQFVHPRQWASFVLIGVR